MTYNSKIEDGFSNGFSMAEVKGDQEIRKESKHESRESHLIEIVHENFFYFS